MSRVLGEPGNAADRERYVTERAEQLARAFLSEMAGREVVEEDVTLVFRDLIDRGVLK